MATSGSFSTTSCGGRNIKFSWNSTQSNNTSTVNWTLTSGGSETVYGIAIRAVSLSITSSNSISGTSSWSTSNYESESHPSRGTTYTPYGEQMKTGTFKITHNSSSGSASFSVSLSAFIYSATVSGSNSYTLPTLLSKSLLALPTTIELGRDLSDMSGMVPISVYLSSDKTTLLNYKHKIKYRYSTMSSGGYVYVKTIKGSSEYVYISSINSDASDYITFTNTVPTSSTLKNHVVLYFSPVESDYKYVSDGTLNMEIVLETYKSDGTTLIGSVSLTKNLTIIDKFKPKINTFSYALDNSSNSVFNSFNLSNTILSNVTKMYAISNSTAYSYIDSSTSSNSFSCNIKTFKITGDITATYTTSSPSNNYTLSNKEFIFNLSKGGELTLNLTVIDDKGVSSNVYTITTDNLTYISYSPPIISSYSVSRSGSNDYGKLNCVYSFTSIKDSNNNEKNSILSTSVSYKIYGQSDSEYIDSTDVITNYNGTLTSTINNLLSGNKYTVKLVITDALGSSSTVTGTITKARTFLHFAPKGIGLAFGKLLDITNTNKRIEIGGDADNNDNFSLQINSGSSIDVLAGAELNYHGNTLCEALYNYQGNYQFYHSYGIDTSEHASGSWQNFTSTNISVPAASLKAGRYLVNYVITLKGTSSSVGMATSRFYNGSSEQVDTNRSRLSVPISSSVNSTINATYIWYCDGSTSFAGWMQLYTTQNFTVSSAFIYVIRLGVGNVAG